MECFKHPRHMAYDTMCAEFQAQRWAGASQSIMQKKKVHHYCGDLSRRISWAVCVVCVIEMKNVLQKFRSKGPLAMEG